MVKKPNWLAVDQLAIFECTTTENKSSQYKHGGGLETGTSTRTMAPRM